MNRAGRQYGKPRADVLARGGGRALVALAQLVRVEANLHHVVDQREQRREREARREERDVAVSTPFNQSLDSVFANDCRIYTI